MPRPKLVSDADILDATRRVLLRQGAAFTLSDVATEVSLSRAALIQRFSNKAGLEQRLAAHHLAALQRLIEASPVTNKGPQRTLDFLDKVLAEFEMSVLLAAAGNAALLREAIVARLDEPSRQRAGEVADLVLTVLTGAAATGDREHVASRLRLALKLIYTGRPN